MTDAAQALYTRIIEVTRDCQAAGFGVAAIRMTREQYVLAFAWLRIPTQKAPMLLGYPVRFTDPEEPQ